MSLASQTAESERLPIIDFTGWLDDEAAERRILDSAEKRLATVQAMIDRQRPGVEGAPDGAQDRYMDLIAERGQLNQVVAKARQALSST